MATTNSRPAALQQRHDAGAAQPTTPEPFDDATDAPPSRARQALTTVLDWMDERWADNETLAWAWSGCCW